ncbi:DUF4254 domain-containing protein [bacterium]|nr:DUF4254 domain-containing protein [bacterium]
MTDRDATALVPTSFEAVDAVLRDVIAVWHEREDRIPDWDACREVMPLTRPEGWARTTELLQLINTFQWHEEDKSRAHGAGDAVLGRVKRSIDASNRRRVQTVDRLDDLIHSGLARAGHLDPAAPLHSESPGSIIDRLSVLALKRHHVAEARDELAGSEEAAAMQARLDTVSEQYADLGACLERLLADVRQGRVGLKFYRQVKVYVDPDTGRLRADLDD